jgi:hypothetical protein
MDRFKLEDSIMSCWSTKEDMDLISSRILEDDDLSKDSLSNALTGLAEIHEMRCRRLFETFEEMISSGRITSDLSEI